MKTQTPAKFGICATALLLSPHFAAGGILKPFDEAPNDYFGRDNSFGFSNNTALVGASYATVDEIVRAGTVYLYRNVDSVSGTATEDAQLRASDPETKSYFGSVTMYGNTGLVGAYGARNNLGAVYVYRDLDTASGIVTENAKLIASNITESALFGTMVHMSGNTAIVGNSSGKSNGVAVSGAAYLYRNLDTASGTVTEDAILAPSDPVWAGRFGSWVAIDGNVGIIGAHGASDGSALAGAAYLFRNLDTATGIVTEDAKLVASDGVENQTQFGTGLTMQGNMAIVRGQNTPSSYLFRNLDTATGTVTENARLVASDYVHVEGQQNLRDVKMSGNTAIISLYNFDTDGELYHGSVYLYQNLDTATGTVSEDVKIKASVETYLFGRRTEIEGDTFLVGGSLMIPDPEDPEYVDLYGRVFTGSVKSLTTLDDGTAKTIYGISFESRKDWIVGEFVSGNTVVLGSGDSASVMSDGKAVYIGKNIGSDNNTLNVYGDIKTKEIHVGASGTSGNLLVLGRDSTYDVETFFLTEGNAIFFEGDFLGNEEIFNALGDVELQAYDNITDSWVTIDESNYEDMLIITLSAQGMLVAMGNFIPEPSAYAAVFGFFTFALAVILKRRHRSIPSKF